ncbi:MAG: M23 family metallopeptidase [Acidovorax sp.]|uniref:M23 family metallopeptidase n=1 Tax=Acidovorax sp. TaxID=1872122 RepID=UPI0022BC8204|nr:M23 family metallopeptidase [Acidovorax sp.]MCZ8218930.1 M23 family metallopeptidase [Acidovorax sp.]
MLCVLGVALLGLVLPERIRIPVAGASARDWNPKSFWFEPWGTSGVHKGIDIFGKTGTPVLSTTDGMVVFAGELAKGGKVVLVLGPRWRLHYFAHLDSIRTRPGMPVASGSTIGTLGASGNAQGKPPHLHYAIVRLLPAPWKIDGATQGYKKAFFIDPHAYLLGH